MAPAADRPQTSPSTRPAVGGRAPERPIAIALVDAHPVMRHGLALLLRGHGVEIVSEAGSAAEAWQLFERERPDVVLLELALPDGRGAELCKRLVERDPALRVLIYTGAPDEDELRRALDAPARGYVLKSAGTEELVQAIRAVARGERHLDPRLGSLRLARESAGRGGVLTDRERELLALLAQGFDVEAIAEELCLSPETVRTHLRNALQKLGASTRAHAVAIAVRVGEITL